jgi:hypothetical protein
MWLVLARVRPIWPVASDMEMSDPCRLALLLLFYSFRHFLKDDLLPFLSRRARFFKAPSPWNEQNIFNFYVRLLRHRGVQRTLLQKKFNILLLDKLPEPESYAADLGVSSHGWVIFKGNVSSDRKKIPGSGINQSREQWWLIGGSSGGSFREQWWLIGSDTRL